MAGEVGQNVGTISIKVTPDTRGFRRTLESEVKAEIAGIDGDVPVRPDTTGFRREVEAETSNLPDAEVKVKANTQPAKAELDAFAKRQLADLKKAASQLEAHIPLDFNGEVSRRMLINEVQALGRDIKATIPVDLEEAANWRSDVEKMVRNVQRDATVQVNMIPKSDGWQQSALAELKKAGNKLEAEVDLTADGEKLRKQLRAAKAEAENLAREPIPLDFDLAADHRRRVLDKVQQFVADVEKAAPIRVGFNDDNLRVGQRLALLSQLEQQKLADAADKERQARNLRAAKEFNTQRLALEKNFQAVASQLDKARAAEVQSTLKAKSEVISYKVDLDYQKAELELAIFRARQAADAISIAVVPDIKAGRFAAARAFISKADGAKGGGALSELGDLLSGIGTKALGAVGNIRAFGIGLVGLVAIAGLVSPAVAILSGALVALPGLLSAVISPLAAVALGFEGIEKAAINAGIAIKDKKGKLKPGPELQKVMDSVGAVFEGGLTPVFTQVVQKLFPQLQASVPKVAEGLTKMAAGFVDTVTSSKGLETIDRIFTNVGAAIGRAAPGVQLFTEGLMTLTDKLAAKFPGLADSFNKLGDQFLGWVNKVTTADPATGVSQFDTAMHNLKGILSEISGLIGDIFKWGWENLGSGAGDKIKEFAADLRRLVTETLPALQTAFSTLATAISPIATLMEGINKGLGWLKSIGDFLSPTGKRIDIFDPSTINSAAETGKKAGEAASQAAKDAAAANSKAVSDLLLGTTQQAAQVPQAVAPATNALDALKAAAAAPVAPPPPIQPPATEPAKAKMSEYQTFVDNVTAQVRGSLQQATSGESLPAPNFEAFKAAWSTIPVFVGEQINAVKTQATTMGESIAAGLNSMTGAITSSFAGLAAAAAPQWEAIKTGAINAFNEITTKAGELPGQITQALSGMALAGQQAGAQLVNGMAQGINANVGSAIVAARNLASQVTAAAKADLGIHSPSRVFKEIGDFTMQGMAEGLENGTGTVLDKLRTIFQAIKDVFGDASGLALNFNLGGGSAGGLTDQLSAVSSGTKQLGKTLGSGGLPGLLNGNAKPGKVSLETQQQMDMLKMRSQELEIQQQQLRIQQAQTGDKGQKAAIKNKIDQLQLEQDQIKLQSQQLQFADKYDDAQQGINVNLDEYLKKGEDAVFGAGQANLKQFMGDIGIQGGGALTTGMDYLADFGKQALGNAFTINVQNVDEAIAFKNNQLNKQALQYN